MTVESKNVIRFKCPDCNATLQAEKQEDTGEIVISVYSSGEPPTKKHNPLRTVADFFFEPPQKKNPPEPKDEPKPGGGE